MFMPLPMYSFIESTPRSVGESKLTKTDKPEEENVAEVTTGASGGMSVLCIVIRLLLSLKNCDPLDTYMRIL